MTDKELLYVQDALGHFKHFAQVCAEVKATGCQNDCANLVSTLSEETADAIADLTNLLKRYGG